MADMQMSCHCEACRELVKRGEPPLPGISVLSHAHLLQSDFPPSRWERQEAALERQRQAAWERQLPLPPVITRKTIRAEIRKFAYDVLPKVLGTMMRESEQQCAALEAQITGLRSAMEQFRYVGPWAEHKTYRAGNFCSMGGQVYHANTDTDSRPGTDSTWTLAVRSGRDGRDGKDAAPTKPPEPRTAKSHR
jgi:hypothetical protein